MKKREIKNNDKVVRKKQTLSEEERKLNRREAIAQETKLKRKNTIIKSIMIALIFIALFLLFMLFKNQILTIVRLSKQGKDEELKEFISNEGLKGAIIIMILEAIQMVVVVIPAEFVQIAAGVSYPIWIAILICVSGVVLGGAIIYLLVNVIKYEGNISSRANNEINEMELNRNNKKKSNAQILMYILFVMPIIPFGAICYYGSGKKVPLHKYLFTCATGVIPSISISWVMGNTVKWFVVNDPKDVIWVFVVIFIAMCVCLFLIGMLLKKIFFGKNVGKYTPNNLYGLFYAISFIFNRMTRRVRLDKARLNEVKGPCVVLANHESFLDICLCVELLKNTELTIVVNEYYKRTLLGKLGKKNLKFIYKKLFYPDIECVKDIMGAIKQGRYILLFPEGRLSTDGSFMGGVNDTARLLKKLNAQLVFLNINGNYMVRPKWSQKLRRGHAEISIREIIEPDELNDLSVNDVANLMNEYLSVDDYKFIDENDYKYKSKDFTLGLNSIIYKCPKCGCEHEMVTYKNHIKCNKCGYDVELLNNYKFKDAYNDLDTIPKWNEYQKEEIRKEISILDEYSYKIECNVTKLDNVRKNKDIKGSGEFVIDKNGYSFNGLLNINENETTNVSFSIPLKNLEAIPFGALEKEFELYYNNELYYFYPINGASICAKVSLIADEIYRKIKTVDN